MKVRINITAKDIREGKRGEPAGCPAALAISRRLGEDYCATVSVAVSIRGRKAFDRHARVPAPKALNEFVADFDAHQAVQPIRFSLHIPDLYLPTSRVPRS